MVRGSQAEWEQHWRSVYDARATQQERVRGRQGDYWGRRAEVFSRRIGAPDGALDLLLSRLKPGDNLLDVGAGAGRYAIPAAARARDVVAVEPSAGMAKALIEEAEKRKVQNIRVLESDWLAADVAPADIVFCAHVLYFTPEAAAFVRKLDAHTLRECMIVIRIDQAGAGLGPLYEEITGERQAPEPSFIDLYNLLYEMGIVANVVVTEGTNSMNRFESLDQAEATVTASLAPPDEVSRAKIRPFLEANLIRWHDGGLTFPGGGLRMAVVSWTKDDRQLA
jgi:SAM-dependent methyltransferase